METLEIQKQLKQRRISQASIARELNRSGTSVSLVIRKEMVSMPIMKAVAAKIGLNWPEIFPEYYVKKVSRKQAA